MSPRRAYTRAIRQTTERRPSVRHGVNDSLYPSTIARSQVSKSVNFDMTPDGLFETRGGSQLLTDTAVASVAANPGLFQFIARATTGALTLRTMFKSGTVLYQYNTSTGVFDSKKTGLSTNKASMVNYVNSAGNEVMVYADGENLFTYDGTTITDIASKFTAGPGSDIPRYLYVKWNVLFASGDDANPDALIFCDPFKPDSDWPAAGSIILEGGVDKVTGLNEIGDHVIVTAVDSIHIVTGRTGATFAPIKVNSNVGCTSHWSIISHGNVTYWANPTGFYMGRLRALEDEGMVVEPISQHMENTYSGIISGGWNNIEGTYHPRFQEIFWSVQSDGANTVDQLFVYSTVQSRPLNPPAEFESGLDLRFVWAGYFSGLDFGSVAVLKDANGRSDLYAAGQTGFVHKMHTGYKDGRAVGVDTGTNIAYEIQSREETYGGVARVTEFLPTFYQKHNGGFNVQFLINRSVLFPTSPINLTFRGNIPYWNNGTDPNISSKWNSTVWTSKPILLARTILKKKCYSIIAIVKSSGSNTQEEGTWIGHDIKHQNISQKQGKAA
jgi:hypothetical protein